MTEEDQSTEKPMQPSSAERIKRVLLYYCKNDGHMAYGFSGRFEKYATPTATVKASKTQATPLSPQGRR